MRNDFLRVEYIAALCAFFFTTPLAAVDIPIAGKVAIVKPGALAKFVSKNPSGIALPTPGSGEDPTVGGAVLRFFDTTAPGAGSVSFVLDASGWQGLGNPAGSKGYKYKGQNDIVDPNGTCKIVLLKETVVKALCHGSAVTLQPPFTGEEGIALSVSAGTAVTQYCAEFGGDETRNDTTLMKRKNALPPAVCPTEPTGFSGFDPNDVITLADDVMQGRNNNTAGSILAQDFLIAELSGIAVGLNSSETGDDAFKQPFTLGTNILAVIPGGELPNEYVMVGAHYDHVGSCTNKELGDVVCNGATDNAAGVAAVLAIGRAIDSLPAPPRRSVILALWDREEDGLLGSEFYVANPLVPLASTIAYINFDIQGANLLPAVKNFSFAISAETGGTGLRAMVDSAVAGVGLETRQFSFVFGQGRSDYYNFVVDGGVPSVFFSDATGPCYHTNQDEVAVVDFGKLEQQSEIGFNLTKALVDTMTPPTFTAPLAPIATFDDAVLLNDVVNAGIADLALFGPSQQTDLLTAQSNLNAIVAAGAGAFDNADMGALIVNAIDVLDALATLPCDGFL